MKTPSKTPKIPRTSITFDDSFIDDYYDNNNDDSDDNDKELIDRDNNSDNLHKSIRKLMELIKDDHATWEKQCQNLREIGT